MSPFVAAAPLPMEPPSIEGINRQYVVEENGRRTVRDGGPRAADAGVVEVRQTVTVSRPDDLDVDGPGNARGIDYEAWSTIVQSPSREGFADSADFVDLFDD